MPRAKKTTEAEAAKPATKPKVTKPKATKARVKAATKPTAPTTVSAATSKVAALEKRLNETEQKLNSLISVMHNDLHRGQLQGPEGLASKLRKAGLLAE